MARLLLVHLASQGVTKVTVINRSLERIQELAKEFPDLTFNMKLMPGMWSTLEEMDIVYPSTASETTIINPQELEECMVKRNAKG